MQKLLPVLMGLLIFSCSAEPPSTEEGVLDPKIDEVVDIRVYPEGKIRFNGSMITVSSLPGHIESLRSSKETRARIIFDETVASGVVFKTQRLLHEKRIANIHTKMLSPKEFERYHQQKVHIDLLSSGKILYEGNQIHPEDLKTSLTNTEISHHTEFIISVSKDAQMGPMLDIQRTLAANNVRKITNEDLSKYYN